MRSLLSKRVIKVFAEDRWSDIPAEAIASLPSHCVVVEKPRGEFLGVVRVKELARKPAERIFADLISNVPTVRMVRGQNTDGVIARFGREKMEDAVILSPAGRFVGVVTRESLTEWRRGLSAPVRSSRVHTLNSGDKNVAEFSLGEQRAALDRALTHLDELSYAISHDVRTPVRAIRGYALALQEDFGPKLDETGREYVTRILCAGERLERLSLGVLSYSQVARTKIIRRACRLDELVREAVEELNLASTGTLQVQPNLGLVQADRDLLGRCVRELLKNAAQFSKPATSPRILVRSEQTDTSVRLWVEDEGVGIRTEHQKRIFELFEQVRPGPRHEHIGVGLASVRKAMERLGGSVGVESQPGVGSKFWLSLPVGSGAA